MGGHAVSQFNILSEVILIPQGKICNLFLCICVGKYGKKYNDKNIINYTMLYFYADGYPL